MGRDFKVKHPLRGVCFVAPDLDRVGGYELSTLALARSLRAHDIPVLVISAVTAACEPTGSSDMVRIDTRGRLALLRAFTRLLAVLTKNRTRFSLIHCPTFSPVSSLVVLAGHILRCPVLLRVATENDVRDLAERRHWKSRIFFALLRTAGAVIAPSIAIRNELRRVGFPDDKIFVVANAVDVERFRPATHEEKTQAKGTLNLPSDTPVIGTVARLVQRKGIDVLLRAFAMVARNRPAHLIVVGDGPLADDLRVLSRDLGIDSSVSWLGYQADPAYWLRAMDVFALPSRLEGSPNAVLEAMATGLPIVATRIGGIVDLLEENKTGILIKPDDPDQLAAVLGQLLGDTDYRADLGSRAHFRAAKEFSHSTGVSKIMELYAILRER